MYKKVFSALGISAAPFIYFNQLKSLSQCEPKPKNPSSSYLRSGFCMIPHPDKAYKSGEDAVYCDDKFLTVLDGVGGWNEVGVDPGLFSK